MSTAPAGDRSRRPLFAQRANDPVAWLPLDHSSLAQAKAEKKLVYVHVSRVADNDQKLHGTALYRDEELAQLLRQRFVCLLVDLDEQPEVAAVVSGVALALKRGLNLPVHLILTHEGLPFFATGALSARGDETQPGLFELLQRTNRLFLEKTDEFTEQAMTLHQELLQRWSRFEARGSLSDEVIRSTFVGLGRTFDSTFHGFGSAPKFAQIPALRFLLSYAHGHESNEAQTMALLSLGAMSVGGFFDQLGSGFFHRSWDRSWQNPQFDKHLGENAELADLYALAYARTGHAPFRRIAISVYDFLISQMKAPEGGFFYRLCSDSARGEHYLFSRRQVKKTLGEPAATHFAQFYSVRDLEAGKQPKALTARATVSEVAKDLGVAEPDLVASLEAGRAQLLRRRAMRGGLFIDDRMFAGDNALCIAALARAAVLFENEAYLEAALRSAERFIDQRTSDGLFPRWLGSSAEAPGSDGSLEDQVHFLRALLDLHQCTLDRNYLVLALAFSKSILSHFTRSETLENGQRVILLSLSRCPKPAPSAPTNILEYYPPPSGDSVFEQPAGVLSSTLYKLGILADRPELVAQARALLAPYVGELRRTPQGATGLVSALDWLLEPIVVVRLSEPSAERDELLRALLGETHHVLVCGPQDEAPSAQAIVVEFNSRSAWNEASPGLFAEARKRRERELLREVHPGRATPAATARFLEERRVSPQSRVIHRGLSLSALGLGSYRIGLDKPAHAAAVTTALRCGIQVIDSSPSFALGDSQRLIGEQLSRAFADGSLKREQIYVICKVGLAIGQEAEQLEQRRLAGGALRATVPLGDPRKHEEKSFKHGAFSLDPLFLASQISLSLARLGLDHLDACLINSPEHLLIAGFDAERLEEALAEAMQCLQAEVEAGRIGEYGLVSNALVTRAQHQNNPRADRIVLEDVLACAARTLGDAAAFGVVEVPVNLVESGALTEPDSVLTVAKEHGLLTLGCRPLSAMTDGALLRLAEVPTSPDEARAEDLNAARYRVASLEAEFETTFAVQLRLAQRAGRDPILPFAGPLGTTLERLATRQQFDQAEATLITPRLRALLSQLEAAFSGQESYQKWKAQYIRAVGAYLACLRETCSAKNRARLAEIEQRVLSSEHLLPKAQRTRWLSQTWSQRSIAPLLGASHLDVVLVGMRSPEQVLDLHPLMTLASPVSP